MKVLLGPGLMAQFPSQACQQPYQVRYSSSHLNDEVKQHWVKTVLGKETPRELLVLLAWARNLMPERV